MSTVLTEAEQVLADKQKRERIIEGVTITVTSGVIIGGIFALWERFKKGVKR